MYLLRVDFNLMKRKINNLYKRYRYLFLILFMCNDALKVQAQTEQYDVFYFTPPTFFIKTEIPQRIQFTLQNSDSSICLIRLYANKRSFKNLKRTVMHQWNSVIRKKLENADKKPSRILSGENLDGWTSALSVGNFYHNKKKSIVMLYSLRKGDASACVVIAFSEKLFQHPVEKFFENLHLVNG